MSAPELPAGEEWATAPLVDQANIGRYVWVSWNGNAPSVQPIAAVGRTNITVGGESLRVGADGSTARSPQSSTYPLYVQTMAARLEAAEMAELRKALTVRIGGASLDELRLIARTMP